MQYDTAVTAGQIANDIAKLTQLVAFFDTMIERGSCFSGQASVSDETYGNQTLNFPSLTHDESIPVFNAAKSAFQARLDALTATLSNL